MTPDQASYDSGLANLCPKTRQLAISKMQPLIERGGYDSEFWFVLKARYLKLTEGERT